MILLLTNILFWNIINIIPFLIICLYYIKYRLIVQLRSGVNIINYKDIANEVNRSPTSIRKWCSKITELSEYTFNFEEIYQGRTRAPIKKPNFTKQEAKE